MNENTYSEGTETPKPWYRSKRAIAIASMAGALVLLMIIAVVYAAIVLPLFAWILNYVSEDSVKLGEVGDSFGLFNALISAAALLFIVYSIRQNNKALEQNEQALKDSRHAIELQHDELEKSNLHFAAQKREMEEQTKFYAKQMAVNQFFQLLNSFHKLIDGFKYEKLEGDLVLTELGNELVRFIKIEKGKKIRLEMGLKEGDRIIDLLEAKQLEYHNNIDSAMAHSGIIKKAYIRLFEEGMNADSKGKRWLAHYFRSLYRLIDFVHSQHLDIFDLSEKYEYIRIARASLSQVELNLLAANGVVDYGEKFKPLIERYDLLNNIEHNELWRAIEFEYDGAGGGEKTYSLKYVIPHLESWLTEDAVSKADTARLSRLMAVLSKYNTDSRLSTIVAIELFNRENSIDKDAIRKFMRSVKKTG